MTNLRELESQVRTAANANRLRRHDVANRGRLLRRAIIGAARKPVVLGSAVLAGFCLGLRENRSSATRRNKPGVLTRILPLAINYFAQTARQDIQTLD